MQCHEKFGRFPWEQQAAIVRSLYPTLFFLLPCVPCFRVSIPSSVRPTLLRQMIWVFNVRIRFGCVPYTRRGGEGGGRGGGGRHKQVIANLFGFLRETDLFYKI